MKLHLKHPTTGAVASFDKDDIAAVEIFAEYVVDGWQPCEPEGERLQTRILALQAKKEAANAHQ